MYPTLRHLFFDMTRIDFPLLGLVQMTGLFFALAFLASGLLLYWELKRRANLGDLKGRSVEIDVGGSLAIGELALHLILGALLGYKGIDLLLRPELYSGPAADKALWSFSHGSWWGALLGAAFFVGWKIWEKDRELKKYPEPQEITQLIMPHDRVGDIVLIVSLSGVAGSKLLYLFESGLQQGLWTALTSLSGLSIYGGLIAALVVLLVYAHRKEIAALQLLDALAPILFLAYGLGRLGGHLAGNGYWGMLADAPVPSGWPIRWASTYPNNLANKGVPIDDCGGYLPSQGDYCLELPEAVYTIGLWEFWICLFVFALLWGLRTKLKPVGMLFALNLIFNALMRWQIERFRVEGFSPTQGIALAMLVGGIGMAGFLLWRSYRSKKKQAQTDVQD
jgi:phosphatidylglycerol:prolipoprotein diacylglycerol transferase